MMTALDPRAATVRKTATTPAERQRLHQEATVLGVARHPGVVRLVGASHDTLDLGAITGWCLEDIGRLTPTEVAGLGAAIATILADLHDLGIVHGGVEPGHVLIGGNGRPVLCSLGRGLAHCRDAGPPRADVAALVAMLSGRLPADRAGDEVHRALGLNGRFGRRHPLTARALARRLAAVGGAALPVPALAHGPASAPGAALPATTSATDATRRPRPRAATTSGAGRQSRPIRLMAAGVAAGVLVVGGVALGGPAGSSSALRHRSPPATRPVCPAADLGCGPVDRRRGAIVTSAGTFTLGRPEDPVVVGRWTCRAALPALLRADRGEIWVWDDWPADGVAAAARLAGRVEGAESLRVVAGASGCDAISVIAKGGGVTTLRPTFS